MLPLFFLPYDVMLPKDNLQIYEVSYSNDHNRILYQDRLAKLHHNRIFGGILLLYQRYVSLPTYQSTPYRKNNGISLMDYGHCAIYPLDTYILAYHIHHRTLELYGLLSGILDYNITWNYDLLVAIHAHCIGKQVLLCAWVIRPY